MRAKYFAAFKGKVIYWLISLGSVIVHLRQHRMRVKRSSLVASFFYSIMLHAHSANVVLTSQLSPRLAVA
jgi:hypothetical protein